MPQPPLIDRRLPLIGHFPYINGIGVDSFAFFREAAQRYGRIFSVAFPGTKYVVMLGPEANRFILERETPYMSWGAAYGAGGKRVFGANALPLIDGEEHRRRRAPMLSAFRPQNIAAFSESMVDLTRSQMRSWTEGVELDFVAEMSEITFRIAAGFLLGVDIGDDYPKFRTIYEKMFSVPSLLMTSLGMSNRDSERRELAKLFGPWIRERREHPRDDVISRLVEAGLDDEDIMAQILIMMFAGHDTTKLSLSWVMGLFLQHPEYLKRVLAEQEEVLGDGPVTPEAMRKLGVLDRGIREANRMFPPASLLQRGVIQEFEFGGFTVPKGWKVMYLPRVTHHLPDVFKDPDTFDPDRFAAPREEHKQPYAMVDFGGGFRTCPGKELSLYEAKVVLSCLLRSFEFTLAPGLKIEAANTGALTRPKHGVKVFVKPTKRSVPKAA
jgi:cytochrome P450